MVGELDNAHAARGSRWETTKINIDGDHVSSVRAAGDLAYLVRERPDGWTESPRQAEICDLQLPVSAHKQILWLEITAG